MSIFDPPERPEPGPNACPDCYGEGRIQMPPVERADAPSLRDVVPEYGRCSTCHGSGVLTRLATAVRRARGGPAPIRRRLI